MSPEAATFPSLSHSPSLSLPSSDVVIDLSGDNLANKQAKPSVYKIIPASPEGRPPPNPQNPLSHPHSLYSLALILLTARQLITRHNKFNNFATGRAGCGSSSLVVVVACASTLRHDKHFN